MADELGRGTTGYQHWLNVVFCPLAVGTPTWVQDDFAARPSTLGKFMRLPDFTQRENR